MIYLFRFVSVIRLDYINDFSFSKEVRKISVKKKSKKNIIYIVNTRNFLPWSYFVCVFVFLFFY